MVPRQRFFRRPQPAHVANEVGLAKEVVRAEVDQLRGRLAEGATDPLQRQQKAADCRGELLLALPRRRPEGEGDGGPGGHGPGGERGELPHRRPPRILRVERQEAALGTGAAAHHRLSQRHHRHPLRHVGSAGRAEVIPKIRYNVYRNIGYNIWDSTGFSCQGRAKLRVFRNAIEHISTQLSPSLTRKLEFTEAPFYRAFYDKISLITLT